MLGLIAEHYDYVKENVIDRFGLNDDEEYDDD